MTIKNQFQDFVTKDIPLAIVVGTVVGIMVWLACNVNGAEPADYYHLPGTVPPPLEPVAKERTYPPYTPLLPDGAKEFKGDGWTQSIAAFTESFGGKPILDPFPIVNLPDKRWHQPGGMEGVNGWKAEKFRFIPEGATVKTLVGPTTVENSAQKYTEHYNPANRRVERVYQFKDDGKPDMNVQQELALRRDYPLGTRFDEVLTNTETGKVFEHRVREKTAPDGFVKWVSRVEFKDEGSRPKGYTGLKSSCSSCHNICGTGKYGAGLIPGGDTVFSDPLDWSLISDGIKVRHPRR